MALVFIGMFQTIVLVCSKASNHYAAILLHNFTKYGNYKRKIWITKSIIDYSGKGQSTTTIKAANYGWPKVLIIVLKVNLVYLWNLNWYGGQQNRLYVMYITMKSNNREIKAAFVLHKQLTYGTYSIDFYWWDVL